MVDYNEFLLIDNDIYADVEKSIGDKISLMLEYFVEDTEHFYNQMTDGYNNKNFSEILKAAHSLKSSSRQIGAVRLSEVAKDIEQIGKDYREQGKDDVDLLFDKLEIISKVLPETLRIYKAKM